MSMYETIAVAATNRDLAERYGGKDEGGILPLFPLHTQTEVFPDLATFLNPDRYPLLSSLNHKVAPAAAIIDNKYPEATLEDRLNALIGLLFVTGFNNLSNGNRHLTKDAGAKSLESLSKLLDLPPYQVILRRNAAYGDLRFEEFYDKMEKEYFIRLKNSSK